MYIRVDFVRPRTCERVGDEWCLSVDGESDVVLPVKETTLLHGDSECGVVGYVTYQSGEE